MRMSSAGPEIGGSRSDSILWEDFRLNHEPGTSLRKKPDDGDDVFMMSFSSLMILLLTFMILMVTLARFREPRFREAIGSVKGAFSFLPHAGGKDPLHDGGAGFLPQENLGASDQGEADSARTYERAVDEIKRKAQLPELAGLEVEETAAGLAIRVSDALMFERGNADLKQGILPVLNLVAEAINHRPGRVSVLGNTCDLPISTQAFPSNWELSMIRAVNVLHYLEANSVPPESLFAYGLADQCPMAANDSEANRTLNRRVEIYVTYTEASDSVREASETENL